MADLTKGANFSPDINSLQSATKISGLTAGSALSMGDAVYIASDGTVKPAVSSQATIPGSPDFAGVVAHDANFGEPVTILGSGARFNYGFGFTPGTQLSVSGNAGKFAINTTSASATVASVISSTDIIIK
jgi:hypothetical protein